MYLNCRTDGRVFDFMKDCTNSTQLFLSSSQACCLEYHKIWKIWARENDFRSFSISAVIFFFSNSSVLSFFSAGHGRDIPRDAQRQRPHSCQLQVKEFRRWRRAHIYVMYTNLLSWYLFVSNICLYYLFSNCIFPRRCLHRLADTDHVLMMLKWVERRLSARLPQVCFNLRLLQEGTYTSSASSNSIGQW